MFKMWSLRREHQRKKKFKSIDNDIIVLDSNTTEFDTAYNTRASL